MGTAKINPERGGELVLLQCATEQFWLRGENNIGGASFIRRRFLNGSIVRFAVTDSGNDTYWDRFFRIFQPTMEIGGMVFDVELQPTPPSGVGSETSRGERSYRVRSSLFARVLSLFGAHPRCFQFTYLVVSPTSVSRVGLREERMKTCTVDVLSVQPYK